jgi:hypothetical protein
VTVQSTRAATRSVRGWVRDALRAETGLSPADQSFSPAPSPAQSPVSADLLAAVVRQRVVELVHAHAAALGLSPDLVEQLGELRAAGRARVPLQLIELSRVQDLLESDGIRHLVFKGPALSVQTTRDLGARGFGDLDLLVDPDSVERVFGLLVANGWMSSEPLPPWGSWAWNRILHTSNELSFSGSCCSVDLHWRLDPTLDALPVFDELWSRRESVDLGGVIASTLGPGDALSHACLNAAKDEWRWLRNLVDIHRLARLDHAWDSFIPGRLQLHALAVTEQQVGLPATLPGPVRERIDGLRPRSATRLLASATSAQERPVRTLHEAPGTATTQFLRYQFAASSSPRDVCRALGALVLPRRVLGDLDATSAWVGVAKGMRQRVSDLTRRSIGDRSDARRQRT